MFIDADTHVDESVETWSYIPKSQMSFVPQSIEFPEAEAPEWLRNPSKSGNGYHRFWYIDGELYPRRIRSDERTGTTVETRELVDIGARLRAMDDMNVATQILYPTVFLDEISERADVQIALYQSYNRWISERSADAKGRMRWVAMIPYHSIPDAVAEMRWAKEAGACGIFKHGVESGDKAASDPYFFPIYEAAQDLDLAICIHTGSQWKPKVSFQSTVRAPDTLSVLSAFAALLEQRVWERYPTLRFGFIEACAEWVTHLIHRAGAKANLDDLRFFVTCEVNEDLAYLVENFGDSNFMVGSDFTHSDRASVMEAHKLIEDRNDLAPDSAHAITSVNATRLYGL